MKGKLLTTAIMSALLVGSNAMASVARDAVFGTQPVFTAAGSSAVAGVVNGSLWYDDEYNVFYNPAYINDNKNYATVQKGLEGGWFKSEFENFAYGVYVNRGGIGNAETTYGGGTLVGPGLNPRSAFIGTATSLKTQRPLDLFFGGDTGVKWGVHLAWAYNRDQLGATQPNNAGGEVTSRYWHVDAGAQVMGFEPFLGLTTSSNYQNTVNSQLAQAALNEFTAGLRYKYEGWSPYAVYHKFREGGSSLASTTQVQTRMNIWGVGFGHDTKVADGVHIYKHVGFYQNAVQDDAGAAGTTPAGTVVTADANKDYKDQIIPLNLAIEGEATSWLTLRGGVSYDLYNERNYSDTSRASGTTSNISNLKASQAGTVKFRLGSTLKFGKLHLDSAFGNGSAAAANGESLDSSAAGFDGQTFAFLSASYHW